MKRVLTSRIEKEKTHLFKKHFKKFKNRFAALVYADLVIKILYGNFNKNKRRLPVPKGIL